jgi:hypothetical protein
MGYRHKNLKDPILNFDDDVPQYQGYQILSGGGALNPKHHVRTLGSWRGALSSLAGYTNKNKNNKLIILMFQRVLTKIGIFQNISYTLWNMSWNLSHPPSLLGQCPKFDRIFFLMASLSYGLPTTCSSSTSSSQSSSYACLGSPWTWWPQCRVGGGWGRIFV